MSENLEIGYAVMRVGFFLGLGIGIGCWVADMVTELIEALSRWAKNRAAR